MGRSMPMKSTIAKHWKGDPRLGSVEDYMGECWACLRSTKHAQRCHVVPRSLGGLDKKDNIVLMCDRCHRAAPDTIDPDVFWLWLQERNSQLTLRLFKDIQELFCEFGLDDRAARLVRERLKVDNSYEQLGQHIGTHGGLISPWSFMGAVREWLRSQGWHPEGEVEVQWVRSWFFRIYVGDKKWTLNRYRGVWCLGVQDGPTTHEAETLHEALKIALGDEELVGAAIEFMFTSALEGRWKVYQT